MGVTIHFEGRIRSASHYEACACKLRQFATECGWPMEEIAEDTRTLGRVQNEEDWDYTGRTRGIELQPDQNADPFRFEVDEELFIQEYCKTQFAPPEVHVKIVDLLRRLEPHFDVLSVIDEGEYFETSDFDLLTEMMDNCFRALDEHLSQNPGSQGPVRMQGGRIVDIIS